MNFPDPVPAAPTDNPLLVPVDTIKALLGVPDVNTLYDAQIAFACQVASALIIDNTGRQLVRASYTEEFHGPQAWSGWWAGGEAPGFFSLNEFPAEGVSAITVNGLGSLGRLRKLHRKLGLVWLDGIGIADEVVIDYVGGYDPLPASLTGLVLELVRRQLGSMGVDLSLAGAAGAGSVKAVSIGQLKVEYVVSTSAADVSAGAASPLLAETLAEFGNVLDLYRHPSRLVAM